MIRNTINRLLSNEGEHSDSNESGPDESDLKFALSLVDREVSRAEEEFERAWYEDWDREGSIEALQEWWGWRTVRRNLSDGFPDTRIYHVDSYFLADAYRLLFENPGEESVAYLTGVVVSESIRTLNRIIEFEHAHQSAGGASGDPASAAEALIDLSENGHRLLGYCHNHPGIGRRRTTPSRTDRENQKRLEAAGYEAVGLIFTEDGFVRFFTNDLDFNIEIYGSGVEREDKDLYKMEDPQNHVNPELAEA